MANKMKRKTNVEHKHNTENYSWSYTNPTFCRVYQAELRYDAYTLTMEIVVYKDIYFLIWLLNTFQILYSTNETKQTRSNKKERKKNNLT